MKINGIVKNIKYRNIDGWSVFSIEEPCSGILTNCTGVLSNIIDINSDVDCEGEFVNSKFGEQLKCSSVVPKPVKIDSEAGVIAILQRLPGVGPVKAKKAVSEYGHEFAWQIAQDCPSMLGITGLNSCLAAQEKAVRIGSSADYEATLYLLSIGLTDHQANRIIETYGAEKAPAIIKENPYRIMADIEGFGFKKADSVALKAGVKLGSTARINACIMYCLTSSEQNDGNIWLNGKYLIKLILTNLKESAMSQGVPLTGLPEYSDVRKCIRGIEEEGRIVVDKVKVYSKLLLDAEKIIFEAVR